MQMHLDFYVDDLAATEARVLAAGATRFDFQPDSDLCFVHADPRRASVLPVDVGRAAVVGDTRIELVTSTV